MRDNFPAALTAVLVHEGGYVNHPRDPGGATNKGVTQRVYNDWRLNHRLPTRSVRDLEQSELEAIYKRQYWDACRCDDLPTGVDYCVFDFAVNSGVNRACRYLQRAAGVLEDGQIGPVTIAAVKAKCGSDAINAVCDTRMAFLKGLNTFDTFGRGWTRRVEDVRAAAKGML